MLAFRDLSFFTSEQRVEILNSSLPVSQQEQKPKRKLSEVSSDGLKLSINAMTTYRWSFEQDVMRYRLAGIDAIGLWLPKLFEYGEERAIDFLAENDLRVSSLSYAGGFTGAFGCQLSDVMVETRDLIRLAGRLRADSLVVLTGPKRNHLNKHARRLVVDSLKELAGEAVDNRLKLCLMPMRPEFKDSWTFLQSLDETLDVLDRVSHPAVKLAFDTYHSGHEPGLLNRLPGFVDRIGVVQVSDSRSKVRDEYDRVLPGEGVLPVEAILQGLINANYRGFVDYQIWSEEGWGAQDLSFVNRCRENFFRLCPVAS